MSALVRLPSLGLAPAADAAAASAAAFDGLDAVGGGLLVLVGAGG